MNEPTTLDVARVLSIISGRWKTVLAITVLAASAAYGYVTFLAEPVYESTARVTYQAYERNKNPTGGALPSTPSTREDIGTLVANATTSTVVATAATAVGMEEQALRRSVTVQPAGDASVVAFVARAGTSAAAAERANAWAEAFVDERLTRARTSLDALVAEKQRAFAAYPKKLAQDDPRLTARNLAATELAAARNDRTVWLASLTLSNPAQQSETAVWPRSTLTMLAAILVGLGLGSGVALLTARVDNRMHGDEFDTLPAPVLARVPASPRAPKNTPLGPTSAEPIVADAFAGLGARVALDRSGEGAHAILVTSARSGEGKSSVAANLASALALGGRRVVLVDADMRRPTQDQVFPVLQGRPGLSQVLTRGAELESALTLVAPNLAAISSGPRHPNASVLLASVAFRQMIERLSQISEIIVIDAPPVLAVNDALAVASAADQVLLVARVGISDLTEVRDAHARLTSAAATPQAMVLMGTERPQGYGYDQELRAGGRVAMPSPAPQARSATHGPGSAAAQAQAEAEHARVIAQAQAQGQARAQAAAHAQASGDPAQADPHGHVAAQQAAHAQHVAQAQQVAQAQHAAAAQAHAAGAASAGAGAAAPREVVTGQVVAQSPAVARAFPGQPPAGGPAGTPGAAFGQPYVAPDATLPSANAGGYDPQSGGQGQVA